MKRILVLTPRFPYPLYGGDVLRIYRLCQALARTYELTLVSICQSDQELTQSLPPSNPFKDVHRVHLPKWISGMNVVRAIVSGECLQTAYYRCAEFASVVDQLAPQHDLVLSHLLRTACYALRFEGPRVLELTDHLPLTYARSNRQAGPGRGIRRLLYLFEESRVDRAQNELAKQFDLVTFVSDVDRDMFVASSGMSSDRVKTFSNGVALEERPFQSVRHGGKIAFIGNMQAMPNADGISHFVEVIFPELRAAFGPLVVKIVGQCPASIRKRLERYDGVEMTGPVASLAEAVSDCAVGICPIRIGAGIQNKMLDYLALGLPAVTTSLGAEGLDANPGEHFLVSDDPGGFAASVADLLRNEPRRMGLAVAGRSLIESHYSWASQFAGLSAVIDEAHRERPRNVKASRSAGAAHL